MRIQITLLAVLSLVVVAANTSADRVNFEFIEHALSADDMSPDGRFIVGSADMDGNGSPDGTYLLDRSTNNMQVLPPLAFSVSAVSDDGTVVAGDIPDPSGVGLNVAARWTAATGWQSIGHLPNAGACPSRSDTFEMSADGSTIVGLSWDGCSGRGFIWTEPDGMQELQVLANGGNRASVVSADGTLIAGFAQGTGSRTPAVWSNDTSGELLDPPNGDALGEIFGMNDEGTVLLGNWITPDSGGLVALANKWSLTNDGWEIQQLGAGAVLPGWVGKPLDIADNGTVIGFDTLFLNRRGWIQPDGEGNLLDIRTYFESNGAELPPGFVIEVPRVISADGRLIAGHGSGTGAWLATILSDCDFDGNLACDIDDVDALVMEIVAGTNDELFDLTGDGVVDIMDRDAWLDQAGEENLVSGNSYLEADANLDGVVDGVDFLSWNANKFSSTGKWSLGDFNADGVTDGGDFVLWNSNKFQSADSVASVPEPSTLSCLLLAGFAFRRRNGKTLSDNVPAPSRRRQTRTHRSANGRKYQLNWR